MVTKRGMNIYSVFLAVVLFAVFLSICTRFFVKNVMYDKYGIMNGFVEFWLKDDGAMSSEGGAGIDWEELYPFEEVDGIEDKQGNYILRITGESNIEAIGYIKKQLENYSQLWLLGQKYVTDAYNEIRYFIGMDMLYDKVC